MIIGLQVFVGNHACGEFLHFMMTHFGSDIFTSQTLQFHSCVYSDFKNKPSVCAGSKNCVASQVILCGRKKVPLPNL